MAFNSKNCLFSVLLFQSQLITSVAGFDSDVGTIEMGVLQVPCLGLILLIVYTKALLQ